jgi:hypothetical protein
VRAYATNGAGTAYGEQMSFTTIESKLPQVTTAAVTEITSTFAKSGGNVINEGSNPVIERGVCWSTSQNPTVNDKKTTDGSGAGTFTSNIAGVVQGKQYYVRAYATNSVGTSYGDQKSFIPKFVIGEDYQGGIIAYIDGTGEHGLIVTFDFYETGIYWGNEMVTGATGTAIGTGKSNTAKIVQAQGPGEYAAKLCDDLVLNGYSDWFLPSKDELNIIYKNIGGGHYNNDVYWSSSENNYKYAWMQDFESGDQYPNDKKYGYPFYGYGYRILPVRNF